MLVRKGGPTLAHFDQYSILSNHTTVNCIAQLGSHDDISRTLSHNVNCSRIPIVSLRDQVLQSSTVGLVQDPVELVCDACFCYTFVVCLELSLPSTQWAVSMLVLIESLSNIMYAVEFGHGLYCVMHCASLFRLHPHHTTFTMPTDNTLAHRIGFVLVTQSIHHQRQRSSF